MTSKTKVYSIFEDERTLRAEFVGILCYQDARAFAQMMAQRERGDFLVKNRVAEETFPSGQFNLCPGCGGRFRYNELHYRRKYGTKRCDCGVLFEIDWEFTPGKDAAIVDVCRHGWESYLKLIERYEKEGKRGVGEFPEDDRRIENVRRWIEQNNPWAVTEDGLMGGAEVGK